MAALIDAEAFPAVKLRCLLVAQDICPTWPPHHEVGAGCTGRVEALAQESLGGSKAFLPVSGFKRTDPGKHMVSVVVGQSFGPDAKVPHG